MNAVEVSNVSKYYALADSQWTRLRRIFSPVHPAPSSSHNRSAARDICALSDIAFSVAEGEALGIIGANGSGKSTLLQIIAGILRPTTGSVRVNGRCSALLELGSGFAPEFSGRQNVHLNGTILGLSQEEINEKFDAIHRFSGIGDFIDQPIRTYSTGMVLRLAFAVVAHSNPRILIVDEALAVGDIAFRQRCMRRIHELRSAGVTMLFVSHDATDVKALCARCLWLEHGRMRRLGEADDVVARYLASTLNPRQHPEPSGVVAEQAKAIATPEKGVHRFGNRAAEVTGISLPGDPAHDSWLRMHVTAKSIIAAPIVGFLVRNDKGENIFGTNSARENHPLPLLNPGDEQAIDFHLNAPRLAPGQYAISVAISNGTLDQYEICDYIEDAITFRVEPHARPVTGYMELPCRAVAIHRN
jgi:ABC-type polysaccharide/polyol phosphate transport system ATPase subunit